MVRRVPIVDGAIAYDCPHQHQTYILLFRNALHIPSMNNNFIPPFIMCERGIIVENMPKIHGNPAIISKHTISFPNIDLKIHLHLHRIFSYSPSRTPLTDEIMHCDKVFITPDSAIWNPHCTSLTESEYSLLTFHGDLIDTTTFTRKNMAFAFKDETHHILSFVLPHWKESIHTSNETADDVELQINTIAYTFATTINLRGSLDTFHASIDKQYEYNKNHSHKLIKPHSHIIVNSINAGKKNGCFPNILVKIWNVTEKLAVGAIIRNT